MKRLSVLLWAAGVLGLQAISAQASAVFASSGTNPATGDYLSASAAFDIVNGNQLQITLSNLGGPAYHPADVLSAVFFNLDGASTLTPLSAALNTGSVLLNGPLPPNQSLGDNWEYLNNLSGIPGQATQGIASAGMGIFGRGNFGSHGQNLRGADFGLVNGGTADSGGQLSGMQLENNSVVFTLGGLPANFNLSAISQVEFQYGTSLSPSEPMLVAHLVPVPEPSALALLALGSTALLLRRRS